MYSFPNAPLLLLIITLPDDGGVGGKHEMDTGVRHQVGLELSDIDIEGTIKTKGGRQGRNHLLMVWGEEKKGGWGWC